MSNKAFTVKELIAELKKLPPEHTVTVSVLYDDCEHMRALTDVHYYDSDNIDWIVLRGGK